jgi:hypothetical protein
MFKTIWFCFCSSISRTLFHVHGADNILVSTGLGLWQCADDVGISSIGDREGADTEVSTAGCSQLNVVSIVVMDSGLGQHSVVLNLRFSKWIPRAGIKSGEPSGGIEVGTSSGDICATRQKFILHHTRLLHSVSH